MTAAQPGHPQAIHTDRLMVEALAAMDSEAARVPLIVAEIPAHRALAVSVHGIRAVLRQHPLDARGWCTTCLHGHGGSIPPVYGCATRAAVADVVLSSWRSR